MRKIAICAVTVLAVFAPLTSNAIDLKDILGKAGTAVGGVVDGLLTKTDLSIEDLAGTWTATGSAVTFQSDNALKKAGGSAVASTIEEKLNPYYQKFGLIGSTMTIQTDGTFKLGVKGKTISGTVTKNNDGTFNFAFQPFGKFKLGTIKAYVQKPVSGLDIMFDASKLKTILESVGSFASNITSLAGTATSLLSSYDGLCVGFSYKK